MKKTTQPKTENGSRPRKVTVSFTERQFKAVGLWAEFEDESIEETLRGCALRTIEGLIDSGDGEFSKWITEAAVA